jgi:hypothetical protein
MVVDACVQTCPAARIAQLDLGRLTSLTALQLESHYQHHALLRADVLPGQLRIGSFRCCASLQPLEELMMLRVLTLENPPGNELALLKGLMTGTLCIVAFCCLAIDWLCQADTLACPQQCLQTTCNNACLCAYCCKHLQ